MPKKSRSLKLEEFDAIDWDPVEAENGNLAKCMRRGIDEFVVWEVLEGDWVDVEMPVDTAEFVVLAQTKSVIKCGRCFSPHPQRAAIGSVQ